MTVIAHQKDLVALVADQDMKFAVTGILSRHQSLGVPPIEADVLVHINRDAGCRSRCDSFLRPFIRDYRHCVVMFDHEGSGAENVERTAVEADVEERLSRNGWDNRAAVIAIAPELEAWVWSDSPSVDRILGWFHSDVTLRSWLIGSGFLGAEESKPRRPKEAYESALRQVRKQKSASIFFDLATNVGFGRCVDPAFVKLKERLTSWFST